MADPLAGRFGDLGAGLLLGVAGTLACLAVWARRPDAPVAGLALAAAGVVALAATGAGAAPALPWPAVAAAALVAGVLLADFDRRWRGHGLALPLLAVSTAGVYATVPDVEAALVVLGAALPFCLLGWPGPLALARRGRRPPSLGAAGALAAAGLLTWTVASGGAGRPGSVVGGLACLGLLAVEPVARRLDPRRRGPLGPLERRPALAWAVLAAQAVLAGVAARVVGRPERAATALLLAAAEAAVALAAALLLVRGGKDRSGRTPNA